MDLRSFCRSTRVLIVAGKGGVGKTTVSASLAVLASRLGLTSLVVELDRGGELTALFGLQGPLGYQERALWPPAAAGQHEGPAEVDEGGTTTVAVARARTITPDEALIEWMRDRGLGKLSNRLAASGAIDVVATAVPGIREVLVLGKVRQLEQTGAADLVLIDAPAAGHALTFLTSPQGLFDAMRVGPIRGQAESVVQMLKDPARAQVLLVALAEETPVNELVETAQKLRDKVGITLAPVVVNGVYPELAGLEEARAALAAGTIIAPAEAKSLAEAADFRLARQRLQRAQMERLSQAVPMPVLALPYMFTPDIGLDEVGTLASALGSAIEATEHP
ncbi:MAG: ArsA family ATPase [Acidimicrobiales bacterium]